MPRRRYQPVGPNERLPDVGAQRYIVKRSKRCNYAMSITKHPDPIGESLAQEAWLESFEGYGPPGMAKPTKFLGLQVWPPPFAAALSPIGKEIGTVGKVVLKFSELIEAGLPGGGRRDEDE
ncbi:hypothetical protein KFL_005030080 [Klebsormidium nitens]|uniref:Uncharacterized protein n=1 Tax=Klebsormidium nitens TaxID=105231 RepID=A0A1Y1IKG1_KLENI|nr:hypothetical protein KFL_005030080 [Klebsormidium nitens]|eukprot:GAQ89256.1 hypothetical protein KFL_005030080 [Klebsormidium nitens]